MKLSPRRIMLAAIMFAIVVAASVGETFGSAIVTTQSPSDSVAVGVATWFYDWPNLTIPDPGFEKDCDRAGALGAKIARTSFRWDGVEPLKGNFRWDVMDYIVNTIIAKVKPQAIVVLLSNTATWAAPSGAGNDYWRTPPQDVQGYKDYLTAIVNRYKGRIEYWEIWNEPNLNTYWLGTPSDYVSLLQASYEAIKAVDPQANVLASLALADYTYVGTLYASGAKPYFDILAVHPYANPHDPQNTTDSVNPESQREYYPTNSKIFDVMAANGDGAKPVWFTELAWAKDWSDWGGVTEAQQAEYMKLSYQMAKENWPQVHAYIWFSSRDTGDGNWGLCNSDGSKRLSWDAFLALATGATLTVKRRA